MKAMRVLNPKAVEEPSFKAMAKKACAVSHGQFTTIPASWVEDQDNTAVIIAHNGKEVTGLCVIFLASFPQVVLFAASSQEARRAIVDYGVDFLRGKGYTRFCAVNTSGAADSVWKRAFWRKGEATKIGTIMEFKL